MWSKGKGWGRSTGVGVESTVFKFKYVAGKSPSEELTFEQRLEGEEGEGHMVMERIVGREGSREDVPGRGNSRYKGKAKGQTGLAEWIEGE